MNDYVKYWRVMHGDESNVRIMLESMNHWWISIWASYVVVL